MDKSMGSAGCAYFASCLVASPGPAELIVGGYEAPTPAPAAAGGWGAAASQPACVYGLAQDCGDGGVLSPQVSCKQPGFVVSDREVLRYFAFFQEPVFDSAADTTADAGFRVRRFVICYYLASSECRGRAHWCVGCCSCPADGGWLAVGW